MGQEWDCIYYCHIFMPKCQNLSQKILFTATKQFRTKNGRFRAFGRCRPMKNRAAKDEDLHTGPTFVHVFCSNFATFRVSVSTLNFQKSTPNFQKALIFFLNERLVLQKSSQQPGNQLFSKPSKNTAFFVQKLFSWRILEIWRPKMAILSILFKKRPGEGSAMRSFIG